MFRRDSILLYSLGGVLLVLTGVVYWSTLMPEWKGYQSNFRDLVAQKFGADKVGQIPVGLQQVWVKDLNRVDRCTTCHQAIAWKGLDNAAHPFRTHPKEILEKHPVSQFGCSICHGGQGFAADTKAAHGLVEFWEDPLMGKTLGDRYVVRDKKALMQMNCNVCHRFDRETKGADYLNQAKNLVQEKSCRACHTINGRGGTIGPDLTRVGEKSPEQYDYARLSGVKSAFAWHVAHLQNPKSLVPESIMPNFNFSTKDAQSLALLVMSWRNQTIPQKYIPGAQRTDRQSAEETAKEKQMLVGEGAFFVKKGCFVCHSVSSFGIESAAKIGPDLADAVTDVRSRFGKTLEDFLRAPTGTMAVVLSTQIQLTDAELMEAIDKLKLAHQRKVEQMAQTAPPTK